MSGVMVRRPGETRWTEIWHLDVRHEDLKAGKDFEVPVHWSKDTGIQEVYRYTITGKRLNPNTNM